MTTPLSLDAQATVPAPSVPDAGSRHRTEMTSKQTFMKLLVAQLRHQDPMSPVENTELVSQLAAVSGVEHLEGIRQLLADRVADARLSDAAFAGGLVGRKVGWEGQTFALTGSPADLDVGYVMPDSGEPLMLRLFDAMGQPVAQCAGKGSRGEVRTESLSALFGKRLPGGSYLLLAQTGSGQAAPVQLQARVRRVDLPADGGQPRLALEGSLPVELSRIRSVY